MTALAHNDHFSHHYSQYCSRHFSHHFSPYLSHHFARQFSLHYLTSHRPRNTRYCSFPNDHTKVYLRIARLLANSCTIHSTSGCKNCRARLAFLRPTKNGRTNPPKKSYNIFSKLLCHHRAGAPTTTGGWCSDNNTQTSCNSSTAMMTPMQTTPNLYFSSSMRFHRQHIDTTVLLLL